MSIKEMDSVTHVIPWRNGQKQVLKFNGYKPKIYTNSCYTHSFFEVLQCLRNEEVLCDIRLETDDGTIVCAHKVVLVSACPYFRAMFTSFSEGAKYVVNIRELDSNILQLLIDYIYTGKIMVTEQNVMDLLPASVLLQLDYIRDVCVEFLKKQLNLSNCLGIKEFADFYNCMDLLSSSEEYIKTHFLKFIETDEFLSLSSEEVINLISCNDINVPFEEKVFECVINWVRHELDCRYDNLPKLMEHVRLSLASQEYISIIVDEEPLIKNNPKCKDFVNEALNFHIVKKHRHITVPQTIRNSPRQTGLKFLLAMCHSSGMGNCYTSWYDPATKLLHKTIKMNMEFELCALVLIKDHLVFALGNNYINLISIEMLDLSSQSLQWKPTVDMLIDRSFYGVGVLDDRIYAVGGDIIGDSQLNSAEVFDVSVQEWRFISNMSTGRMNLGVAVLNNLLYVVGGYNYPFALKSVECYDPTLDIWIPVTEMSTNRRGPGIGVLDGVIYAIGGDCQEYDNSVYLKSVEAYTPITKVWSSIADMHLCRSDPRVVTFNGLLYVMGGFNGSTRLDSIEIYDPKTNTWTLDTLSTSVEVIYGAVVVDGSPHLRTD
ncbi:ring canal kelch homolog [Metopolophium dirhodum]|uniref:ring canal kelch homolog n=1 Tax=Metopolophium dirhodum TaxID=44670 RepID=UPI00298FA463|nr:ring canal kelch homolog [Metopolophium dirhodum]XP_060872937.1 ring canal kelch homolog [Metopolophium dirhodum]